MKNIEKDYFFGNLGKKIIAMVLICFMTVSVSQPFPYLNAAVTSGAGNSISGANGNFVNSANSGAYNIAFNFSGSLDAGNTFLITAMDGSGKTVTGSLLSASGGESSGSIALNFNTSGWLEGGLSFNGIVYSGGIATPEVASGMVFTGMLDVTAPGVVLSSAAPSTISGAISVNATVSESASGFALNDILLTNAAASGFSQNTSTGYSFIVTPSVSTGTVAVSIGTGAFSDLAGNSSTVSNTLSYNTSGTGTNGTGGTDTTPPVITISSPADNATVSGFPTLSGSVSDSGGVASVSINGLAATLGSGTWSKIVYDLTGGLNTVTVIATDLTGNTGSAVVHLNRVSLPYNTNVSLSGTTSAIITFSTDLSATGVVLYATGLNLTGATSHSGVTFGTTHTFVLTNLLSDTVYYFAVQGQGGIASTTMHFKTPTIIDISSASGSISATSSVYLSGVTASGAVFSNTGSLGILSLTSSGSSISIPLNGLRITSSGGNWDGVLQAPEVTSDRVNLSLSGYAFTGTFYQIGNANTELVFSGQSVSISIRLGVSLSGQTVRVFRSPDQGVTYTELSSCVVSGSGDCVFSTSQLSRFAFAVPADVIPNSFSFSGITNAEFSTAYISNSVTMSGIAGQTAVSIMGGQYSINSTPFTNLTGSINSGDTVVLRVVSSATGSTSTSATLTVGGVSGTFTVTTKTGTSTTPGTGGSSGGGGGGGGGGGTTTPDYCPGGDTSPSYYDRICSGTTGTGSTGSGTTGTGVVGSTSVNTPITPIFTGSVFHVPPVIIANLGDINFVDVEGNWAEFYIIRMVIRGIVDNVAYYRPDDSLTRAEFLKIVINTAGWNTGTTDMSIPFNDVSLNIWYAPYVSLALSKGMITGANPGFRPNDPITRAEATKILMAASGLRIDEPSTFTFVDLVLNSDLNKYIEVARTKGILSGQMNANGQWIFRPNDPITRAEIAKVVVNAFGL